MDRINPDHQYLWGGQEPQGTVLACDFYNAGAVSTLSDEDIVSSLIEDMIPTAVRPKFPQIPPNPHTNPPQSPH